MIKFYAFNTDHEQEPSSLGSSLFSKKLEATYLGEQFVVINNWFSGLKIYHNGTNSFIENSTGSLYIRDTTDGDIRIQGKSGEDSIIANDDGAVELYHDNSKKFETTSAGVSVSGTVTSTGATVNGVLGGSWYTLSQSSPSGGNNGDFWFKY